MYSMVRSWNGNDLTCACWCRFAKHNCPVREQWKVLMRPVHDIMGHYTLTGCHIRVETARLPMQRLRPGQSECLISKKQQKPRWKASSGITCNWWKQHNRTEQNTQIAVQSVICWGKFGARVQSESHANCSIWRYTLRGCVVVLYTARLLMQWEIRSHDIREKAKPHLKASSGTTIINVTDVSNRMEQNRICRVQYSLWHAEGKFGCCQSTIWITFKSSHSGMNHTYLLKLEYFIKQHVSAAGTK